MYRKNKKYSLEELKEISSKIEHDFVETNGLVYIITKKDKWTFKQVDDRWKFI